MGSSEPRPLDHEEAYHSGAEDASAPIALVRQGMRVVDADGEEIGKVAYVKMGDPQAVTLAGQEPTGEGLFDTLAELAGSEGEPKVPSPAREQLLRTGFIRIDAKGFFASDRYASADAIASVTAGTVVLKIAKNDLIEQD